MSNLGNSADRLRKWMFNDAWPFWARCGINSQNRFYETLSFDGCPTGSLLSRVRTQARQVYSFALAHELGWNTECSAQIVSQTLPVLLRTALRPDGVAGRVINIETGDLVDPTADLYDSAFVLLALAQSRDIVGHSTADSWIKQLLANIDTVLAHTGDNGYRESVPGTQSRLQNPHMHFFESLLLLYEKTNSAEVGERAEKLFSFIDKMFFEYEARCMREKVVCSSGKVSSGYDPGHSMEWVWLMGYRARLPEGELPEHIFELYERACSAQKRYGVIPMYLTDDNEPIDGSARLWSQVEALKGHLCMAELGHADLSLQAIHGATSCASQIIEKWLDTACRGGWLDHFDADGQLISDSMPASTGYHVYLALSELDRVAKKLADD